MICAQGVYNWIRVVDVCSTGHLFKDNYADCLYLRSFSVCSSGFHQHLTVCLGVC